MELNGTPFLFWIPQLSQNGDRLLDGYEVSFTHTNPLLPDSDGNGITDDMEDLDMDGLTNYQEFLLGTEPLISDTDWDGLPDSDEINIHNTDPTKYDTDGDGLGDALEFTYGTDPTNPDTNENGISDGDEIYTVTKSF